MGKSYSFEEVKDIFGFYDYTLLDKAYKNNTTPMLCRCPNGHESKITLSNFSSGKRCVQCYRQRSRKSFSEIKEAFIKEGYFVDQDFYETADKPIKCICPEGHKITITWHKFKIGRRCKICSGLRKKYSLSEVRSVLEDNGYTLDQNYYDGVHTLIKCVCPKKHHIDISFANFMAGYRCSVCAVEDRRFSLDEVRDIFSKESYIVKQDYYINNCTPIRCVCPNGHEINIRLSGFISGKRCRYCFSYHSRAEKEICSLIKLRYSGLVIENTREVISPYELDIFVPEKNLAIEYCGLYWHGELVSGHARDYHYRKMKLCNDKGIRLITVFEDEYKNRPDVVMSRIYNALGVIEKKVYARKCYVKEISFSSAKSFLDRYHLQGVSSSTTRWGLFLGEELLQVLTVGYVSRAHAGSIGILELKRFASLPNIVVVGGAGKLFAEAKKYALINGISLIKSYCDMRYASSRPIYEQLGFCLFGQSKYTPHYIKNGVRYRNQGLRKTPVERNTDKTEWELRQEQGYDRLWDCGHRTYIYRL